MTRGQMIIEGNSDDFESFLNQLDIDDLADMLAGVYCRKCICKSFCKKSDEAKACREIIKEWLNEDEKRMITIKENELYQEIELYVDGQKIGEAEVDIKGHMLSRLSIFPPYQDKGYGTEIVKMLTEKYGLDVLWVNADNKRAIHTYEKNGYEIVEPTMYLMKRGGKE